VRLARLLKPLHEQLQREAAASDVLHADETGWHVAGKTWWLWCFTNARVVYYVIARIRGLDPAETLYSLIKSHLATGSMLPLPAPVTSVG